ncbi:MAG: TetR/AcrR family transcriptional regulator [Sphingobacteriales bacterium]|nr:MAG: TetR/AcrR family transcriptional regulator [Sphingobacteriales bacterium]
MKNKIVQNAQELFFRYGIKTVTMEDIARHVGISKKTLYTFFDDKNELATAAVENLISTQVSLLRQCRADARDAIDEVFLSSILPFHGVAAINPLFFYQLERFHSPSWNIIRSHSDKTLRFMIAENLETGIKAGYYRQELDTGFIADIRVEQVRDAIINKNQKDMTAETLMQQLTEFYLHGITNEKGKKLIAKYSKEYHGNHQ